MKTSHKIILAILVSTKLLVAASNAHAQDLMNIDVNAMNNAWNAQQNATMNDQLGQMIHAPTWLSVHAERAVSRALGGSCSMPLAAHAVWQGDQLVMTAALGHAEDTARPLLRTRVQAAIAADSGPAATAAADALGRQAAAQLRDLGAEAYLAAAPAV